MLPVFCGALCSPDFWAVPPQGVSKVIERFFYQFVVKYQVPVLICERWTSNCYVLASVGKACKEWLVLTNKLFGCYVQEINL
jgi:hypothetical protein